MAKTKTLRWNTSTHKRYFCDWTEDPKRGPFNGPRLVVHIFCCHLLEWMSVASLVLHTREKHLRLHANAIASATFFTMSMIKNSYIQQPMEVTLWSIWIHLCSFYIWIMFFHKVIKN